MKRIAVWGTLAAILAAGCATTPRQPKASATLIIESEPSQAIIYASPGLEGPWGEFRKEEGRHVTPSRTAIGPSEFFWVKLKKQGYRDSEPVFVRGEASGEIPVRVTLEPVGDVAEVFIDSEPAGATVLAAESRDGAYSPWLNASGEPITPARGSAPVGDSFWVKVVKDGYKESEPQPIYIADTRPVHASIKLGKWRQPGEPLRQARLSVRSNPPGALVLVSPDEFGQYSPWPSADPSRRTPLETMVDVGNSFWLKVRRDGYDSSEPVLLTFPDESPVTIEVDLAPLRPETSVPALEQAAAPGIVADGYALISDSVGQARQAAILDALSVAVQEKYGAKLFSQSAAQNYMLASNRVEVLASGEFTRYDVIQEDQENEVYHVRLRVLFKDDLLRAIQAENIFILVASVEKAVAGQQPLTGAEARSGAMEALVTAGAQVKAWEQPVENSADLARITRAEQADLALLIRATGVLHDRFGEFYSYKTSAEYTLIEPAEGVALAQGHVEWLNKERRLNECEAATHSMREAGAKAAEDALHQFAERYTRVARHSVFITGIDNRRDVDRVLEELRRAPGVRDAQLVGFQNSTCEARLIVAAGDSAQVSGVVQGLRNLDLEVVEADRYTTIAQIR